nr:harmonin isoform X1 [Leptinotarsa decemlineata]XP_023011708.1 harmonin isoform X1 [Leptinotarsa decemlineata]
MMTMEYPIAQHKYAYSTVSSETLSGSCGSRNNRIRTIRLKRRNSGNSPLSTINGRHAPALGFSLRGGHEHGTGFFISHVEPGSEAHAQGLKVGDQIIRINGFTIEDAIHKEVLQLISNHHHLTLKVRGVGMIPVKEKKTDTLSWQIISDTNSSPRSSPQFVEKNCDVRINIMVSPRSKLGCGICKGPDWKPGIFVQFTKEAGIAREAGLRPGDQILQCNNVDFSDIPFNEAVNLMKNSRQLDLLVRKASNAELFPGESSGYNSSASSVTEDQSPPWVDPKRLSIVKEENQNLDERLNNHRRLQKTATSPCKEWNLSEWDEEPQEKNVFKPTIINLSENGTTIKNNGTECQTIAHDTENEDNEECQVPPQQDTKIVVDVHRSNEEDTNDCSNRLTKSPSGSSLTSKASFTSAASNSLSSALSMEISRRVKNRAAKVEESIDELLQKKKMLNGISTDQQYQHNKLMNEFKEAHQKMFKSPSELECSKKMTALGKETMERLAHKELSQKLSHKLLNLANSDLQDRRLQTDDEKLPPPPPPPPPSKTSSTSAATTPVIDTQPSNIRINTLKSNKTKPKAPPVPAKHSVLSFRQPPPCPTPDYDTISLSSTSSTIKPTNQLIQESVEMDSLDSFKMNNPASNNPKPPSTYFQKKLLSAQSSNASISSAGALEKPKSVSVTIGEYPSARSQPGRLDFLKRGEKSYTGGSLAHELSQTLKKSNLRKRTESMENLFSSPQIKPQSNGSVRISVSNLSREFAKSTNDLTEDFGTKSGNRVKININQAKFGS